MLYTDECNEKDSRVREYLIPKKIIKTFGNVENVNILLERKSRQIGLGETKFVKLTSTSAEKAGILIDFGFEFCGGACISVYTAKADEGKAKLRLSFGESANEALSALGEKNACNDHAPRDFVVDAVNFSTNEWGFTGYRFLFLQLITEGEVTVKTVQGIAVYQPFELFGSFESDDKVLNDIYNTALHTCHMCIQNEIWDGIKRDRLVWIGDLSPELKTVKYAFGDIPQIESGLKHCAQLAPIGSWMNGIGTYSIWWIINAEEWCSYKGDNSFIEANKTYVIALIRQIIDNCDDSGVFMADKFIDWPTHQTASAAEGVKALSKMFFVSAEKICESLNETELKVKCRSYIDSLSQLKCSPEGFKQVASLLILNNIASPECYDLLKSDGANGLSTFMSYYIFSAMAKFMDDETVLDILKEYYGKMLQLGATTFWEDFDISWAKKCCRLDEICPPDKTDIHGDNGKFCYTGFRHSLCHGWSSGPVPFLTEYVLGVNVISSGCATIKLVPHLGHLNSVKGSFFTPAGKVTVWHKKDENGNIITEFQAPEGIKILL